jgi:3-keto-disaccharide hydrolase
MKPLSILVSFGLLASSGKIVTFDSGQVGRAPAGWTFEDTSRGTAPQWEIRKDQTAPTPPYVLAQVSHAGGRCPLAIYNDLKLRDGDVSVRIKAVSSREDQAGGVVFRYRDANNYYLARENAVAHNVAIFKVENGRARQITPAVPHDISPNTWNILKVSVRGNRFQVYMNHRRILQAWDQTFNGWGRVGLWTEADSVTYFDDFRVYPK